MRANGLDFRVLRQGSGEPLVLLHGFTGSADSWLPMFDDLSWWSCDPVVGATPASPGGPPGHNRTGGHSPSARGRPGDAGVAPTKRLRLQDISTTASSGGYQVNAIDLLGHGKSATPKDHFHYAFAQAVDDLAAVLTALEIDRAIWLGYSLGGRLALGAAITHPERVSALVLESATAGIREERERARRRASDDALADRIEARGIEAFVAEWESLPMWASQQSLASGVRATQRGQRLANSPTGLANSLRGMGQGAQPSLWDRLGEVRAPTLLIAGTLDTKFANLAAEMHQCIPDSQLVLVPHAGHAVHVECPTRFTGIVKEFLAMRHRAASQRRRRSPVERRMATGWVV